MKEAKRLWSWLAIPCIALAVLTGSIVTVLLTVCIMLVVTGRKRPSCRSAPGEGAAS